MANLLTACLTANLAVGSDEMMNLAAAAYVASKASATFDPNILDFDGNGKLNANDASYITSHYGMTTYVTCYRNNPFAWREIILKHRSS